MIRKTINRRNFIAGAGTAVAAATVIPGKTFASLPVRPNPTKLYSIGSQDEEPEVPFKISLAEWSLHRTIRNERL